MASSIKELRALDKRLAKALNIGIQYFFMDEYPYYSTDPAAMLELDGEMQRRGYSLDLCRDGDRWEAAYGRELEGSIFKSHVIAVTMSEAVACAALAALEKEAV